jgi:hypothetical protein
MKRRVILAIATGVSGVSLCHCDPCSPEPASFVALSDAVGHEFGFDQFPKDSCPPPVTDPSLSDQAIGSGAASACAAASGDDDCVTCAKTSCCAVSLVCWQDPSCTCLVACRTAGCAADEISRCGQQNVRLEAITACLADHCAKECPAQ